MNIGTRNGCRLIHCSRILRGRSHFWPKLEATSSCGCPWQLHRACHIRGNMGHVVITACWHLWLVSCARASACSSVMNWYCSCMCTSKCTSCAGVSWFAICLIVGLLLVHIVAVVSCLQLRKKIQRLKSLLQHAVFSTIWTRSVFRDFAMVSPL